jgi:uncharacterized protein with HEPN domain
MNNEIRKCLYDIIVSVESIDNYLENVKDINSYKANKMVRRAVEREFEIIGEAMNRIDKLDANLNISGKRQISNMRNRVIHGYDKIDDEIIWGTIIRHLPVLKREVEILLQVKK